MKVLLLAAGVLSIAGAWHNQAKSDEVVLVIGGDVHGYLSPCGCTKPMSGGIRRRATAVRTLTAGKRAIVLENGGLVHGLGRQDEIKAETLAEALKATGCDAIHLTSREAAMGRGMVETVARLLGKPFLSASIAGDNLPVKESIVIEGVAVFGASMKGDAIARDLGTQPVALEDAIDSQTVRAGGKPLVLLLEGTEADARRIAEGHPAIKVIVYSSIGDPPSEPIKVGETLLVTPGEKGKSLLRLRYRAGAFDGYSVVKLDPEYPDDAKVAGVYGRYLDRVTAEKLLERLPRTATAKYAGNPTCGTCHIEEMLEWEKTRHASALHTLELEKHDRDPDCVKCHVTGLSSEFGFRSRKETSHLTDVGCESCHGPGLEHAYNAGKTRMPVVGEASCLPCHDKENSPNFDYAKYWDKVKH